MPLQSEDRSSENVIAASAPCSMSHRSNPAAIALEIARKLYDFLSKLHLYCHAPPKKLAGSVYLFAARVSWNAPEWNNPMDITQQQGIPCGEGIRHLNFNFPELLFF
jgi:hypothetical protein